MEMYLLLLLPVLENNLFLCKRNSVFLLLVQFFPTKISPGLTSVRQQHSIFIQELFKSSSETFWGYLLLFLQGPNFVSNAYSLIFFNVVGIMHPSFLRSLSEITIPSSYLKSLKGTYASLEFETLS